MEALIGRSKYNSSNQHV